MDHQKQNRAPEGTGDAALLSIDHARKRVNQEYSPARERTLAPRVPQILSITQLGVGASRWRVCFAHMPDRPVIVETIALFNARRLECAVFRQLFVAMPLGDCRKWWSYVASVFEHVLTPPESPTSPPPAGRASRRRLEGGGR